MILMSPYNKTARIALSLLCFWFYPLAVLSDVEQSTNPASGLSSWKTTGQDFSVELVQVNPEYTLAVFAARGLPMEVVEEVGRHCVFGTIVRNLAQTPVSYHLSDWRLVTDDGVEHKLKLKSEWVSEWSAKGVGFRWLLLADGQRFDEGDWIQGFTTTTLEPGHTFDLYYSWSREGKVYKRQIKGVQCAPAKPAT